MQEGFSGWVWVRITEASATEVSVLFYFYSYCFFVLMPLFAESCLQYTVIISWLGWMDICSRWNMKIVIRTAFSFSKYFHSLTNCWLVYTYHMLTAWEWEEDNTDKFPGLVIAHWAVMCEYVFKDIPPEKHALILHKILLKQAQWSNWSCQSCRQIEAAPPSLILQFFTRYKVPRDNCNKKWKACSR